jgi:hypothetical protein
MMILLYLASVLTAKAFSIECTVLNFILATSVLVIMLVTSVIYSGSPIKSRGY